MQPGGSNFGGGGSNYGGGYPGGPNNQQPGNGMATAALVVGIVALGLYWINWFIPFLEVVVGIVGIVLAINAKKQGFVGGKNTAGLVCSIIAVALGGISWIACTIACIACQSVINDLSNPNHWNW